MKICYLGENISVHNQKWIEALSVQPDVELHVVSFKRGVEFKNVVYHYMKKYTGDRVDYLLNIFRVRKIVKRVKPDILHAHYATSHGFLGACCNYHPFIVTGWGADIFDTSKEPVMRILLKWTFQKADAITVLSEVTRQEIKKLTQKNVQLIPFGVDVNKFKPSEKKDDSKLRIGTIRTLSEKYGVEFLIRAFGKLCSIYPDIQLEIVGDGDLRYALEAMTKELGITDRVVFHGFISQKTDFQKYYSILSQLDIFAILSILDSETFGVASVEASACGIPVVASDVGGLPEVILHGKTGMIVPRGDSDATAKALELLIIDEALRKSMGREGREHVLKNYDWDKCVLDMMDLYSNLIKNK
jgi:glycosyltransferase involved in cell wall biosynthesis